MPTMHAEQVHTASMLAWTILTGLAMARTYTVLQAVLPWERLRIRTPLQEQMWNIAQLPEVARHSVPEYHTRSVKHPCYRPVQIRNDPALHDIWDNDWLICLLVTVPSSKANNAWTHSLTLSQLSLPKGMWQCQNRQRRCNVSVTL